MRRNILKFVQQGLWPSLSGGWYYDPDHSNFTNIFHLYSWLFLLCLPFCLYLMASITWGVIGAYVGSLLVFFSTIKLANSYFHHTFDEGEKINKNIAEVGSDGNIREVEACDPPVQPADEIVSEEEGKGDEATNKMDTPGHMEMWDELAKQSFADDELFPGTEPLQAKVTMADVHDQATMLRCPEVHKQPQVDNGADVHEKVEIHRPVDEQREFEIPDKIILRDKSDENSCAVMELKKHDNDSEASGDKVVESTDMPRMRRRDGFRTRKRASKKPVSQASGDGVHKVRKARKRTAEQAVLSDIPDLKRLSISQNEAAGMEEKSSVVLQSGASGDQSRDMEMTVNEFLCERSSCVSTTSSSTCDTAAGTVTSRPLPPAGVQRPLKPPRKTSTFYPSDDSANSSESDTAAFLATLRRPCDWPTEYDKDKESTMLLPPPKPMRLPDHSAIGGSSSDSDGSMEENYKECLQNFRRIQPPHEGIGRSMSTRQAVRHRAHRARRARRSQSLRARPASYQSPHDASRETRHRHPAGDKKPEENNNSELAVRDTHVHLATDHADTTDGAVHCFQDEFGNWMTYTFGGATTVATEVSTNHEMPPMHSALAINRSSRTSSSSQPPANDNEAPSISSSYAARIAEWSCYGRRLPQEQRLLDVLTQQIDATRRVPGAEVSPTSLTSQLDLGVRQPTPKVKSYYKVQVLPSKSITVKYDRLSLMDLLDRNVMLIESVVSILLASSCGLLGLLVLAQGHLFELWSFWFCVVITTSQFSMIRSVQPDSASPTHGHNRVIAYSRPIYFNISCLLLLLFHYLAQPTNIPMDGIPILGVNVLSNTACGFARDFMLVFTCLLPVVFMFGLLPQINTFTLYLCEQVEMHVFGGTASTSFGASIFGVVRSLFTCFLLYGFCYGAMINPETSQHILFSVFCGLLVASSYHLSRQTSSPWTFWSLLKSRILLDEPRPVAQSCDPAEEANRVSSNYMLHAVSDRLQSDVVSCLLSCVLFFALHCSTVVSTSQPYLSTVLYILVASVGFLLHYLFPQLRKNLPWSIFSQPILRSHEYSMFEVKEAAKVMWFERCYVFLCFIERNIILPTLVINELTRDAPALVKIYGHTLGCAFIVICGVKMMRGSFTTPASQFKISVLTVLFMKYDARQYTGPILMAYPIFAWIFTKLEELILKLQFWLVYVCPWQITWGSAFHAVAQVCSVPHSALLTLHALVASLLQAPFTPFIGSALFISSYPRPIKFWEKNYNTKRIDHSNSRLSSQLDRGPHSDHNNLNSLFYEHLTLSLQKSLAGDLELGRWGNVVAGDCFILASDYLNALVHVVELGNGMVTFQLRGLEFNGTYCQQREVEAINEGADTSENCCCCRIRKINGVLSFNSAFNQRWIAWQVIVSNYVLDGYNVSANNATTMLGVFDLRKILISYIVKSVIFFLIAHESLASWLVNESIREQLSSCEQADYVDVDSMFAVAIDDDYDVWLFGISRSKFIQVYSSWINYCCAQKASKTNSTDHSNDSNLTTLCFAVSVLARRALGTASHNLSSNLDSFLHGLYSLFKGDFRITSAKDEWVFADMNLMRHVVAPGVRMALKLHQDHFVCPEEYEQHDALYSAILDYHQNMVITHEGDPLWRKSVLSNTTSLLALRRVVSDTFVDQYSVVSLNHRALGFIVVKVNRECVRGLWAGQQNELIYLRNRNPERGSIQNAKQVLRNMINSSCDQPIGYPIYVSPLTTSYATTNQQLNKVIGGPITFHYIKDRFNNFINCLQQSCAGSCNSGGSGGFQPANQSIPMVHIAPRNYSNEPIPQLRSLRPSNENARSRHGSLISGDKRARSSVSSSSTIRKLETSFRSNREADNLPSISAISGSSSRSNSTSDNQRPSSSVPRLDSSLRTSSVARSDRFRPTNSFVRLHDPAQNLSCGL